MPDETESLILGGAVAAVGAYAYTRFVDGDDGGNGADGGDVPESRQTLSGRAIAALLAAGRETAQADPEPRPEPEPRELEISLTGMGGDTAMRGADPTQNTDRDADPRFDTDEGEPDDGSNNAFAAYAPDDGASATPEPTDEQDMALDGSDMGEPDDGSNNAFAAYTPDDGADGTPDTDSAMTTADPTQNTDRDADPRVDTDSETGEPDDGSNNAFAAYTDDDGDSAMSKADPTQNTDRDADPRIDSDDGEPDGTSNNAFAAYTEDDGEPDKTPEPTAEQDRLFDGTAGEPDEDDSAGGADDDDDGGEVEKGDFGGAFDKWL